MRDDLPTPDQIMEELADRAVAQIDRRAPVAFDGALGELVRYHRFVLALSATETEDGEPFSYAEVSGAAWHAPHVEWIRQYRRLFDRAAERIPYEERFLETLAYVPLRLLETEPGIRLSRAVVDGILDLGPVLMHAVETWVTRRSLVEAGADGPAERTGLSGSDARALSNALPSVVGAWESMLDGVSRIHGWRAVTAPTDQDQWTRYVAAWPFLRQHLANTAYCLAVAVWNGDQTGARLFREALVRWPGSALLDIHRDGMDRFPWLMMPDTLDLHWDMARTRAATLEHPFLPGPTPDGLFTEIMDGVRNDVVAVTASTLVVWSIAGGPATELAAATARELIGGVGADPTEPHRQAYDFKAMLETLIRLQMVGERYQDGTYGSWLDRLVRNLDNVREGRVVPGRVYQPTTMNHREDLIMGDLALLAALAPAEGTGGAADDLDAIAQDDALLPDGDRSLRDVLGEFDRYRSILAQQQPGLERAIHAIDPAVDPAAATAALGRALDEVGGVIKQRRLERLHAMDIDADVVEAARAAIEAAVLAEPAEVPFFADVSTFAAEEGQGEERQVSFNGIQKGRLIRPEMEQANSGWSGTIAKHAREAAGDYAFQVFARRPREQVDIDANLDDAAFWRDVAPLAARVGEDPILIVAHQDSAERLMRSRLRRDDPLAGLRISYERPPRERGRFVATIEGIAVFTAGIPPGTAWLVSAHHLRSVGYAPVDGGRVSLGYRPDAPDALTGSLVASFRQVLEWSEGPVLEIRMPGTVTDDGTAKKAIH